MSKLPVDLSEFEFEEYILPHLTHKVNHNRQKVSYHYVFNTILYVLKSGCSWRTLKPENKTVTWQNIYYHYAKWSQDGSFENLFTNTTTLIRKNLALECLQLDGSHTPSKKGDKV
jgi:transposase